MYLAGMMRVIILLTCFAMSQIGVGIWEIVGRRFPILWSLTVPYMYLEENSTVTGLKVLSWFYLLIYVISLLTSIFRLLMGLQLILEKLLVTEDSVQFGFVIILVENEVVWLLRLRVDLLNLDV